MYALYHKRFSKHENKILMAKTNNYNFKNVFSQQDGATFHTILQTSEHSREARFIRFFRPQNLRMKRFRSERFCA